MEQSNDESLGTLLSNVDRKMGRCILRLQQYEILMKRMVSHSEFSCYAGDFKAYQTARKTTVSRKTLGQLVAELTGSSLFIPASKLQVQAGDSVAELDPTRAHIQMRFRVKMTDKDYQRTKEGLAQLVALRNELVHHFVERFNPLTESSCHAADLYLDDAYQTIDEQFRALYGWAQFIDDLRKTAAEYAVGTMSFMSLGYSKHRNG